MAKKNVHNVRKFIIDNIENHPSDIASFAAKHFSITRQAVNRHLKILVEKTLLIEDGKTRNKKYKLNSIKILKNEYKIADKPEEDIVWRNDIKPNLQDCSENVIDILDYAFTEMFNNAVEHSEGTLINVVLLKNAKFITLHIFDNGIGIFKKIKNKLNLQNDKYAIFELSKGKLTTDPKNHTGEGIFFTSRVVDCFTILSGSVGFTHLNSCDFDMLDDISNRNGTEVFFGINRDSENDLEKIFLEFAPGDSFSFKKTIIPIRLAEYGEVKLISRSQAKRVLNRVILFKNVVLDFSGITFIGQGFADQIFRVFTEANPQIKITSVNTSTKVRNMILHVKGK